MLYLYVVCVDVLSQPVAEISLPALQWKVSNPKPLTGTTICYPHTVHDCTAPQLESSHPSRSICHKQVAYQGGKSLLCAENTGTGLQS